MAEGYQIDRDFVMRFVEELRKRGRPVKESLFCLPGEELLKFAKLVGLPYDTIIEFTRHNDCDRADPQYFDCPPTYGLKMRRALVLLLIDKVGR